jgi:hypothetical protein
MDFRIPEPCEERWEEMEERPGGRFCRRCQHTVVDLSRMSRRQAQARVGRAGGGYLCVQLALDEQGAPLFRPEPSRAPRWAGGLVLVAALGAGGCDDRASADSPVITEPACALEEAPMLPVSVQTPPMEPLPGLVEEAEVGADDGPVVPSAEQRELTRRKQLRQPQPHTPQPHPHTHVRGRIPLPG